VRDKIRLENEEKERIA